MGIPRLISHLQPYFLSATLGSRSSGCVKFDVGSSEKCIIIIDGPGLAFFIYYRLLANKSASLNAIDAVPTYDEIGKSFLIFLAELRAFGLTV